MLQGKPGGVPSPIQSSTSLLVRASKTVTSCQGCWQAQLLAAAAANARSSGSSANFALILIFMLCLEAFVLFRGAALWRLPFRDSMRPRHRRPSCATSGLKAAV